MNLHKASFKAATVLLKSMSSVEEGKEASAENTEISKSFWVLFMLRSILRPFIV